MSRPRFGPTAAIIYGAVGLTAAALSGLALWQMQPTSRPDPVGPLPLIGEFRGAPTLARRSDVAALRLNARARLALSPADTGAWMSLAYAARAEQGRCGPACAGAMDKAYAVAPLDPVTFAWRTRFALENWGALPPALRARAITHMRHAWSTPEGRLAMKDMGKTVRDPAGRLAARMVAGALRAQPLARSAS